MCGIGLIASSKPTTWGAQKMRVLKLLLSLEDRGKDATGIALINSSTDPEKETLHLIKQPVTASDFIRTKLFKGIEDAEPFNVCLIHTRSATTGDKKDNHNNHPIFLDSCGAVLVHNGVLSNDDELKKTHALKCTGEVDSEVIGRMFELKKFNMKKAISKLRGSMAFFLYHKGALYAYKHTSPLIMAYLPKEDLIIGASTLDAIEYGIKDVVVYKGVFAKFAEGPDYATCDFTDDMLLTIDLATLDLKRSNADTAPYVAPTYTQTQNTLTGTDRKRWADPDNWDWDYRTHNWKARKKARNPRYSYGLDTDGDKDDYAELRAVYREIDYMAQFFGNRHLKKEVDFFD